MGYGWIVIVGLLIGGYFYATTEPSIKDSINEKITGVIQDITKSNQTEINSTESDNITIPYDIPEEFVVNGITYVRKNSVC